MNYFRACLILLLAALNCPAAEVFSVSAIDQAVTASQVARELDGMRLTAELSGEPALVEFKGEFVLVNDSPRRRHVGGQLFLLRDGEIIDRTEPAIPVGTREFVFLPIRLSAFDQPGAGAHEYSVWWTSLSTNKVKLEVNRRSLSVLAP